MRVLVMAHLFPPAHNAGAERMVLALLRALVDRGHDVDVVLSQDHKEITTPYDVHGIQVHPHRSKNDPFAFIGGADLIVTHLENTQRASILGQMYGIPVAHVCHNTFPQTGSWLRRGGPALAVFNSQWMAKHFADVPVRSIVIRPPVAVEDYATTPGDSITLINLFVSKGPHVFYGLAERFPDRHFLGVKGAYGEQVVKDLPNVEVIDHIDGDHMSAKVYSRTRVLLVPSVYESYGRVGIEAMASGIPVLAHPTEGLKESLGDAGLFADRDDLDAWERQLRMLLDGRRWNAASRKARKRADQANPDIDVALWCDTVEEVAGARTRRRR